MKEGTRQRRTYDRHPRTLRHQHLAAPIAVQSRGLGDGGFVGGGGGAGGEVRVGAGRGGAGSYGATPGDAEAEREGGG